MSISEGLKEIGHILLISYFLGLDVEQSVQVLRGLATHLDHAAKVNVRLVEECDNAVKNDKIRPDAFPIEYILIEVTQVLCSETDDYADKECLDIWDYGLSSRGIDAIQIWLPVQLDLSLLEEV